jgi:hypothetical protein
MYADLQLRERDDGDRSFVRQLLRRETSPALVPDEDRRV